jgi:hypothetical protein
MSNSRYPVIVFSFVVLISILVPIFCHSHLPITVASHFNFKNEANAWMNRKSFLIIQLALTVFLAGIFFSFALFIPKLPKSIINLPNKDYWLSDERKDKSFSVIRSFMYWFGSITIAFMFAVFQLVYIVNVTGKDKLNSIIWLYLILFLICTTLLIIRMISNFKNSTIKIYRAKNEKSN